MGLAEEGSASFLTGEKFSLRYGCIGGASALT
jgi:hypothetical protein